MKLRRRLPKLSSPIFMMCIGFILGIMSLFHHRLLFSIISDSKSEVHEVAKPQVREANANQYCSCILITSQGGVGSSSFLDPIDKSKKYCVNDVSNRDWLKHQPATKYPFHTSYGIHTRKYKKRVCFGKVLVIVGDPLHTIQSTYKRFGWGHINLLRKWSKEFPGLSGFNETHDLNDVYDMIVSSGKDVTGITYYIQSWYNASQNTAEWPEIKMVTTEFLYNHGNDVATWLGIDDEALQEKLSQMSYDVTKADDYTIGVPAATVNVFRKTNELVNQIGKEAAI